MNVETAKHTVISAESDPQTTLLAIRRLIEYDEITPDMEDVLIDYELKADDHPAWEEVVEVLTDALASLPPYKECRK